MSGLFISNDDLKKLSKTTFQELLALCTGGISHLEKELTDDDIAYIAVDLSSGQAVELVNGLSDKSCTTLIHAIEIIQAAGEDDKVGFWANDLAKAMNIELQALSGVWSGLTRRTRKVVKDSEARLIHWLPWDYEREDNFGFIHPTTVANLKRALDI